MRILKNVMLNAAADAGAGGGGGAPAGGEGSAAPAAGGDAGAGGSLLSGGDAPLHELIPEKYRVSKDDKSFDLDASTRKLAAGYSELAKKLGSGEAPPKSPEEYAPKVEGIEGFNWDEFKADPKSQSFLKGAHAKGLTNDQVSFVLGEYLKSAGDLVGGTKTLTQEEARAELQKSWKEPAQFEAGIRNAARTVKAFAGDNAELAAAIDKKYGDDPLFLQLAAWMGAQMGEDKPVGDTNGGGTAVDNIDELLRSEAYHNPRHPDHAKVSEKVRKHFEKVHGTAPAI